MEAGKGMTERQPLGLGWEQGGYQPNSDKQWNLGLETELTYEYGYRSETRPGVRIQRGKACEQSEPNQDDIVEDRSCGPCESVKEVKVGC